MLKRSMLFGLLAGALLAGSSVNAKAATVDPSLGAAAQTIAGVTHVRWVCGPYRCAWIPRYRGRVVVYPYMRGWKRPRSPHCIYEHRLFGWELVCP